MASAASDGGYRLREPVWLDWALFLLLVAYVFWIFSATLSGVPWP